MNLKPDFKTYVLYAFTKFASLTVLFLLIFFGISSVLFKENFNIFTFVFILSSTLLLIWFLHLFIRYSKEHYELLSDRLRVNYGGIFTNTSKEVLYRNIVMLSLKKPFIETNIFNTGSIEISSAATSELTKINLNVIRNADSIFEVLNKKLKKSTIKQNDLISTQKPHFVGIFINLLWESSIKVLGIILSLYYVLSVDLNVIENLDIMVRYTFFALVITSILFSSLKYLFSSVIKFLDILKREYKLYYDYAYYHDGFFNKTYHLILLKNISDTSVSQNFIQNLLGIYNVIISAKGSGNQIVFEFMQNGEQFEKKLDALLKTEPAKKEITIKKTPSEIEIIKQTEIKTYQQNFNRALAGYILTLPIYIIIPVLLIFFVKEIIKAIVTKYYIDSDSIVEEFRFLKNEKFRFKADKITTFKIRKNLLDRIFETFTLSFTSFGSSKKIDFKNIDENLDLVNYIKKLLGYKTQNKASRIINPKLELFAYVIKNVPLFLVWLIATLFLISIYIAFKINFLIFFIVLSFVIYIFFIIINWFRLRSQKLTLYKDFLIFETGILVNEIIFLRYDDIKDLKTLSYAFTNLGDLSLNIAGGAGEIQTEEGKTPYLSNIVTISMLDDINSVCNNFDHILESNKFTTDSIEETVRSTIKPHLLNSILIYLIFPFLWPVLPFVLINTVLTTYTISNKRIIKTSGFWFKFKETILINKVDIIDLYTDLINNLFNTGNIIINTAGSTMPEITIKNVENYKKITTIIKSTYK